jgi:hypothetical protein
MHSATIRAASVMTVAALFGCAIHACSATTPPSVFASEEAGADAAIVTCPTSPPGNGVRCPDPGLVCAYGDDPTLDCNLVATCGSGVWQVSMRGGPTCPTKNPSGCAATKNQTRQGDTCTAIEGTCKYPNGECACRVSCGPASTLPSPPPPPCDAGTPPTWTCSSTPQHGCPETRPRLGSPCVPTDPPDLGCKYDLQGCIAGSLACVNGAWQLKHDPCPL